MPKPVKKRSKTLNDATLPAPVRKAVRKTKRPSSDPISRAKQLQAEHEAKVAGSTPPWGKQTEPLPAPTFAEQFSAHMKALGSKGGKIGGKRRMETMSAKDRSEVALRAARARWAKPRPKKD